LAAGTADAAAAKGEAKDEVEVELQAGEQKEEVGLDPLGLLADYASSNDASEADD
jgi:hypothetical protein